MKAFFSSLLISLGLGLFTFWVARIFWFTGGALWVGAGAFVIFFPLLLRSASTAQKRLEELIAGLGVPVVWHDSAAWMRDKKPLPVAVALTDHFLVLITQDKKPMRTDLPLAEVASLQYAMIGNGMFGPIIFMRDGRSFPLYMPQGYDLFKTRLAAVMAHRGQGGSGEADDSQIL